MKYTLIVLAIAMTSMMSCNSSKETVSNDMPTEVRGERGNQRGGKGNVEEMFSKMDANNDSKLSKLEVKGPLAENFDKVDTNNDGFITMEEMKNAPRPKRGNRGPR